MMSVFSREADDSFLLPALEQNIMAIVMINDCDEVVFFNAAAEQLWKYSKEEVIGNDISVLLPVRLRKDHPGFIRRNRESGVSRVAGMSRELLLERKDGNLLWTRFALSRIDVHGSIHYLAIVRDVSIEMTRQEQQRLLIVAMSHIDQPVIVLDESRQIVQLNRAFTDMSGHDIQDAAGKTPDVLLNIPDTPSGNKERLSELLSKATRDHIECLLTGRHGEPVWIKASLTPVCDASLRLQNLVITFTDITEEQQVRKLERDVLAALCGSQSFQDTGNIICRGIHNLVPDVAVILYYLENDTMHQWASSAREDLITTENIARSFPVRLRDGTTAGMLEFKFSTTSKSDVIIERVADISVHLCVLAIDQEKSRLQIEKLVQYDPLTGLPNRNNLHRYIDDLLSVRETSEPVIFAITIDNSQDIIDALGYTVADQAILIIANRLRALTPPEQFLSKTDSFQFVLVSTERDIASITQLAQSLQMAVAKPVVVKTHNFHLTLSTGISQEKGKDRDELLSAALSAMDYIRKSGGNDWQFFNPAMNQAVRERLHMGSALKQAIAEKRLRLVYQPQIAADSGELYGFEALARWYDPEYGDIPPSRFIPLAEETGDVEDIGTWGIQEVCRQLSQWRAMSLTIPAISVNLSARHFQNPSLPDVIMAALNEFRITGRQLTIEITENTVMELNEEMVNRLREIRNLGVGLSVDDFGTGFSGLSRLVSLPVSEIKIDKSFTDRCLTESRLKALLEAVTGIGRSLNMVVIAEGIESKQQLEFMRSILCPVIQGYFFSRPVEADAVYDWINTELPKLKNSELYITPPVNVS